MTTRARLILVATAAIALAVIASAAWRAHSKRQIIAGFVPERPDLAAFPPEFAERIASAEARARGVFRPTRGIGELATLYHANGFHYEAAACYEGLELLELREPRWAYLHASILAGGGRLEDAIPRLRRAVELAPDYLPARVRLGDALVKTNQLREAEGAYGDILSRQPTEPYALLGLARCAIANDDWPKARELLQRCTAANSNFIGGLILQATVLERLGAAAEANAIRARVGQAEPLDVPDPWADALLAECHDSYRLSVAAAVAATRGDSATAEKWLHRAIGFSRAPAPFHRQIARLYTQRNDVAAARYHFERAVALEPTDSDAWAYLVDLLRNVGDRAAAYDAVRNGLMHCPDSRALHFAHGQMLREDGRLPQALAEFRHAKRLQPNEANAYVEIALIYFRLEQIEAGIAEMKNVLAVVPDHPLALTILARHAIETDDQAAARDYLRRARLQSGVKPADLQTITEEFQRKFGRAP